MAKPFTLLEIVTTTLRNQRPTPMKEPEAMNGTSELSQMIEALEMKSGTSPWIDAEGDCMRCGCPVEDPEDHECRPSK